MPELSAAVPVAAICFARLMHLRTQLLGAMVGEILKQ